MEKISIFEVTKAKWAASEHAEEIFALLSLALSNKTEVMLSFKDIEIITSSFLVIAIGQLTEHFNAKEIGLISYEGTNGKILKRIQNTIKAGTMYYSDRIAAMMAILDSLESIPEDREGEPADDSDPAEVDSFTESCVTMLKNQNGCLNINCNLCPFANMDEECRAVAINDDLSPVKKYLESKGINVEMRNNVDNKIMVNKIMS